MFKNFMKEMVRRVEKYSIYHPEKEHLDDPADYGFSCRDVWIRTSDDVNLHAWYIPSSHSRYLWIFFHGNAGNISHRLPYCEELNRNGYSVLVVDYRGYGLSEGFPSEEGLYLDALAADHYAKNHLLQTGQKLVLFGRSLGGAVAIDLSTRNVPDALILENTFTSAKDMSKIMYPYIPVSGFINVSFDSIGKIGTIHLPVMIIHSGRDEVVPINMGKRLYNRLDHPGKFFLLIPVGNHNNAWLAGGKEYWENINMFLEKI